MTTDRVLDEAVMFDEIELMEQFPDVVFGDVFAIALTVDRMFHLFTEKDDVWTLQMTAPMSVLRGFVTVGKKALAIKNGR